jgi:hypothetical protein
MTPAEEAASDMKSLVQEICELAKRRGMPLDECICTEARIVISRHFADVVKAGDEMEVKIEKMVGILDHPTRSVSQFDRDELHATLSVWRAARGTA